MVVPPLALVPPVLPPRFVPVPVDVPPLEEEPPLLVADEPALALLEPPCEEEEPPTAMLLPRALLDSLLPPAADELELELELLLDPPLPPLELLELEEDDEFELSALCEGGAKAQPRRPLVARRARMGGERNFMRVLLRCI